jgi:hypothetical protein
MNTDQMRGGAVSTREMEMLASELVPKAINEIRTRQERIAA